MLLFDSIERVDGPEFIFITEESTLILSDTAPSPMSSATIEIVTFESFTGHFSNINVSVRFSIFLFKICAT